MSRVCVRSGRFHLCTAVVVAGFLLLGGRLFHLQVLEAAELAAAGEEVRQRLVRLEPRRGDILDRNGNLLAGTRSRILLGVDPQIADTRDGTAWRALSRILGQPMGVLLKEAARTERTDSSGRTRLVRWVPLAEIGEEAYAAVLELKMPGVYGNRRYERYYPGRQQSAHLIGFVNKEGTPVMGVERALDYYLEGQAGWRETEVDGRRRELAAFRDREVAPADGLQVHLSIDLVAQSIAEAAIAQVVAETRPEGVSVIVSRPRTGEILALANHPTFDPNTFWDFPIGNQRNRALLDQYEPGSTYKIVPVAAALEEGLVQPDTLIDCTVERRLFNGVSIPMPSDHRNLGVVPVSTVVAKSSNRGAAQIGMMLGEERMYAWSRQFGFGQPVQWPLPGTASGSLLPVERWDGYTISRLPTGYAVGATAMQVHLAMATLANGGVRVEPRLLLKVVNPRSGAVIPLGPDRSTRVVSEETARIMRELLLAVVSPEGTASRARIPGFQVAGKTGTSRKIIDGHYSHTEHVASFSGFFPASNPEVVITVVVDNAEVSGPAYGGLVAAPVFQAIGSKLIPHLAIRKPEQWDPFIASND